MDIYGQNVLDHYKNPKNYGKLKNPTITVSEINFSCGDSQEFDVLLENEIIKDIAFRGKGCAISRASASLLTEKLKGKRIELIKNMDEKTVKELLGFDLGLTRLKCAFLPLAALKKALVQNPSIK